MHEGGLASRRRAIRHSWNSVVGWLAQGLDDQKPVTFRNPSTCFSATSSAQKIKPPLLNRITCLWS